MLRAAAAFPGNHEAPPLPAHCLQILCCSSKRGLGLLGAKLLRIKVNAQSGCRWLRSKPRRRICHEDLGFVCGPSAKANPGICLTAADSLQEKRQAVPFSDPSRVCVFVFPFIFSFFSSFFLGGGVLSCVCWLSVGLFSSGASSMALSFPRSRGAASVACPAELREVGGPWHPHAIHAGGFVKRAERMESAAALQVFFVFLILFFPAKGRNGCSQEPGLELPPVARQGVADRPLQVPPSVSWLP